MKNKRPIKRKPPKPVVAPYPNSDYNFAVIIGFTSGGAAYGITHEEWERICYQTEMEPIYVKEMNLTSVNDKNYHPDEFYNLPVFS